MRFLKNKIRLAQEHNLKTEFAKTEVQQALSPSATEATTEVTELESPTLNMSPQPEEKLNIESEDQNNKSKAQRKRGKRDPTDAKMTSPTKNIILNYAKAIASFATSTLALPYLHYHITNGYLNYKEFVEFVSTEKANIGGIKSFKNLLIVKDTDTPQIILYKEIFRMLSLIFVRDFSVNWITYGRVTHKEIYLKYRLQILQKLQNPEEFIYFIRNQAQK